MTLSGLDWTIIALFFIVSLGIGLLVARRSGKDTAEFFLSGRNMPWWLLGVSMVATTFSADTPNFVTNVVRTQGVSGNWAWWAFLLTGMLTVFVYAQLWRRSGVLTDLEFYELRYSGPAARFLRGFRAIYLGVFFNIMIMASVSLAAIKIGSVLLGLSAYETLAIASIVTVIYSMLGGLRGVIYTDFIQFFLAMLGSIWAAWVILDHPEIQGLENLLAHPNVSDKLSLIPDFNDRDMFITVLIIPLAVQWWSVWYPGAEPGGGGYVAQRMLAAKDEKNAMAATLFFNIAHYALRPWPWIIIALASLVVFPDLASIAATFPHIDPDVIAIKDDLAYSAMLTYLPAGLLGLVVASLVAAYMSTISSHLNWGSSYVVNDWYKRFYKPEATEKEMVAVGRWATLILMILSAFFALQLESALGAFQILLKIGAGTGLIFILRWFWWRINAYSELTAMIVSFVLAIYLDMVHEKLGFAAMAEHVKLLTSVGLTTVAWVAVTFLTRPTEQGVLVSFYKKIKPAARGWQPVIDKAISAKEITSAEVHAGKLPLQILGMFAGCFLVYGALFGTGYFIYGNITQGILAFVVSGVSGLVIFSLWKKIQTI